MNAEETNWILPVVVMLVGFFGGIWAALLLRRRDAVVVESETAVRDLEVRYNDCLALLRDLEHQRTRLSAEAYAQQRSEYETKAAGLLRERDRLQALDIRAKEEKTAEKTAEKAAETAANTGSTQATPATPLTGTATGALSAQLRGALWGGGAVAVIALLFWLVSSEQRPRVGDMPITGGMGEATATGSAANSMSARSNSGQEQGQEQATAQRGASSVSDDELRILRERLEKNPKDMGAILQVAHLLLRENRYKEAKMANDQVLSIDPKNTEALIHAAYLHSSNGDSTKAFDELNSLLAKQPKLAEAWFFRGLLGIQLQNAQVMRESFERFVEFAPEGTERSSVALLLRKLTDPTDNMMQPPAQAQGN